MDTRAKDAEYDRGYGKKDKTANLSPAFLLEGFNRGRLHATAVPC